MWWVNLITYIFLSDINIDKRQRFKRVYYSLKPDETDNSLATFKFLEFAKS